MRLKSSPIIILIFILLLSACSSISDRNTFSDEDRIIIAEKLDEGWTALWNDEFKTAESSFETVLQKAGHNTEAMRGRALALFSRGKYFESADLLLTTLEKEPSSPYAVPICDFIQSEFPYSLALQKRLLKVYESMSASEQPLSTRREGILGQMSYYRNVDLSVKKVKACADMLNTVSDWNVLGPFPNISSSGLDIPFIYEQEKKDIDPETVFRGIDNIPIQWHKPSKVSNSGSFIVSEYTNAVNSTNYAETSFDIDSSGEYLLIFTQSGALKCWIDGTEIIADARYRYAAEMHWVKIELDEGPHKILIKSSNETGNCGFRVSLEQYNGSFHVYPDPIVKSLEQMPIKNIGKIENLFWQALMLNTKDYHEESRLRVQSARELLPSGTSALWDLAESIICGSEGDSTGGYSSLMKPAGRNILFAPTVEFTVNKLIDQERWNAALDLIGQAETDFGEWFYGTALSALINAYTKGEEEARTDFEEFYELYPDSPYLDLRLLNNYGNDSIYSFSELTNRIGDKGLPVTSTFRKMRRYLRSEKYNFAFIAAGILKNQLPEREEVWAGYIESGLYSAYIDLNDSKDILQDCIEDFPLSVDILNIERLRSEIIIERLGSNDKSAVSSKNIAALEIENAILAKTLRSILTLNPSDVDLREKYRSLTSQEPLNSFLGYQDPFKVIEEFRQQPPMENADSVIVLDDDIDAYFDDGGIIYRRQDVIKIISNTAVEQNSTFFMDFNPDRSDVNIRIACILREDGTQIDALRSGRRLSFPGLRTGDFIVVSYTCFTSRGGSLMTELWDNFTLNDYSYIFRKEHSIFYPDSLDLKIKYHNSDDLVIEETNTAVDDSMKKLKISVSNASPVKPERWSPNWQDIHAWADLSSFSGWNEISSWYHDIYNGQCAPTSEITELTEKIISGAEDREDIIRRIYSFVSGTIYYEDLSFQYAAHVPQKAGSVLSDGYGDCKDQTVLLISMLRAAGIDSYAALSQPGYRGDNTFLPSPRFTHVFAIIKNDGDEIILDPTSSVYTYPELPAGLSGTYYLPILADAKNSSVQSLEKIVILDNGKSWFVSHLDADEDKCSIQTIGLYFGFHAQVVRELLSLSDTDYSMQLFDMLMESELPGYQLESMEAKNIDDLEQAPLIDFTGTIKDVILPSASNTFSLDLPWSVSLPKSLLSAVSSPDRKLDLNIDYPELSTAQKQTIITSLPPGYSLQQLPDDAVYYFGEARAVFHFSVENRKIICEKELFIPVMTVEPERFSDFSEFLNSISRKEKQLVQLKKTIPYTWVN